MEKIGWVALTLHASWQSLLGPKPVGKLLRTFLHRFGPPHVEATHELPQQLLMLMEIEVIVINMLHETPP